MSTIRVDNFGPSAGGTTYSARGIAKAWVNFNGTGTIAARDSQNVSSLTDNAVGDYTVNFSNAFGAADYSITCSCSGETGARSTITDVIIATGAAAARTTLAVRVGCTVPNASVNDAAFVDVSARGDLA